MKTTGAVLVLGRKTGSPYIVSDADGGQVDKLHVVYLKCDTPDAVVYYTTDGSMPEVYKLSNKVRLSFIL